MSRSRILHRMQHVLQEAAAVLPELPEFPAYDDPVVKFARELELAGGVFLDARMNRIRQCLDELVERSGARHLFWEDESIFKCQGLPYRLRDPLAYQQGKLVYSIHLKPCCSWPLILHSKPASLKELADAPLALTTAQYGIAETGTVAVPIGPKRGRLLTMITPIQAVVLSSDRLMQNSAEFFSRWQPADRSSLLTMITGPSRTADIEKTLVTGVHGPARQFVILTDPFTQG